MEVKAIKVVQPLGEFYISKIKAGDLLKISTLKSASNLNGNLNCSKELEHYAS